MTETKVEQIKFSITPKDLVRAQEKEAKRLDDRLTQTITNKLPNVIASLERRLCQEAVNSPDIRCYRVDTNDVCRSQDIDSINWSAFNKLICDALVKAGFRVVGTSCAGNTVDIFWG